MTVSLFPSLAMNINSSNFNLLGLALPDSVPNPGALRRIAFDIEKGILLFTELDAPKADGKLDAINIIELPITDDQKRAFIVTMQVGNLIKDSEFVDNAARLSLQKFATGCAAAVGNFNLDIGINVGTEAMKLVGRQNETRLDSIGNNWSSFMLTVDLITGKVDTFKNLNHMSVMKDFVDNNFVILDGFRFQKVTNDEMIAAIDNNRDFIDLFDLDRFCKIEDDVPHMLMRGVDGKVLTTDGLNTIVFKLTEGASEFESGTIDGIVQPALDPDGHIDTGWFVRIEGSPYDNTLISSRVDFEDLPVDARNQFSQI